MFRCEAVMAVLLSAAAAAADDAFPEPSALPARPELPDPLVMLNGERVPTKEQWQTKRKPELRALFQHYMYGDMPQAPPKVEARVRHEDRKALGGKARLREVELTFGGAGPTLYLLVVVPNDHKGPAPAFVGLNFCGNHAVVDDPGVRLPTAWMYPNRVGVKDNRATEEGRGKEKDTWAIDQTIARGYAVALFYPGDLDPDRNDVWSWSWRGKGRDTGHDTTTIAVWAWGVSRVVDYLTTDKDIDAKRLAAVGHSRLGKTVLLAAAFDERIALAIPHQAGCGGTAPSRQNDPKAESVKRINTSFPHWFCGNFKKFNDDVTRLPFDQNCLAALCAPRPLLFSNATEDLWANPSGQFTVLKAAEPAYRLLGAGGVEADKMPEVGTLSAGTLGYYIRPGKHSMTREDWKVFLDFADRHLGKARP
jgi:hypothetical protein